MAADSMHRPDFADETHGELPHNAGHMPAHCTRRMLICCGLTAGLGLLIGGCASSGDSTGRAVATHRMPPPSWPGSSGETTRTVPRPPVAEATAPTTGSSPTITALPRTRWAGGRPVPTLMDPMLPVRHITLHHDGIDAMNGTSVSASAGRLESIRRSHRGRGWGDIGYHFAVDRAGRVWSGRPLQWQGAHVKDCNEHNIGVVALGNFELQRPTPAQLEGISNVIRELMAAYDVPASQLRTHREWSATLCPGRHLQTAYSAMRSRGMMS